MGWQDAPLVEQAPGKAAWQSAPLAEPPSILDRIRENIGNLVAGGVRGAGSVGATVVDAARSKLAAPTLDAVPQNMRPQVTTGLAEMPVGRDLRASMDAGMRALGFDPDSIAYGTGKLGAEIAGTLGVGGVVGKGLQAAGATRLGTAVASGGFRTGAPVATTLASKAADLGVRTAGGAISGGATAAAVDPEQAGAGAAVGAVAPTALRTVGKVTDTAAKGVRGAVQGTKAAIEPFTEAGRSAIAARALAQAAGDDVANVAPRLEQAAELLPGSAPTAAQVAENGGIASLERAMAARNPTPFTERAMEQASARAQALREIAGDEGQRAAAVSAREAAVGDLYGQAKGATYAMDERLQRLLQTPAMKAALARAKTLAENNERQFMFEVPRTDVMSGLGNVRPSGGMQVTGQGLMDLKMAIDDMLTDPASGYAGAAGNAVRDLRSKLLVWMEDVNPVFRDARTTYSEMSKPVSQMDIGGALLEKLEPALADHGALAKETAGRYAQALRNADQTARNATGFRGAGMRDVMTPEQMKVMENIAADLARKANAQDLGRGVGSNTFQNFAMNNIAERAGAPRAVGAMLNAPILRKIPQMVYEGTEPKIEAEIVKALMQPKTAAQLMREEMARQALQGAPRQPMLSPGAQQAVELLFARTSPLLATGQ